MLDVVFLSNVIPLEIKEEVLSKRKDMMSESGESLQWKIIGGLDENLGYPVRMLNHMLVRSYPTYYPDAYIHRMEFSHGPGARDVNLPFLNVRYIKRLFMGSSLYREITRWAGDGSGDRKVIIAYSLTPEFTKAIALAKQKNPEITACAIVADLPEYTVLTNQTDLSTKVYLNWMRDRTNAQLSAIDCFVLLTEQMAGRLVTHQKYMVMEGIATDHITRVCREKESRTILYAGTLHERFGVRHLVSAFERTSNEALRLVLCGMGDSEEFIKAAAAKDPRIDFRGQLTREAVLSLMEEADVIVNPRCTDEEFTQYSFPSKNLEALSSGVPFIGYKLAGIPDDYDAWINYPADGSEEALAGLMEDVCLDRDGTYAEKAVRARQWVLSEKNALAQTEKILELIQKVGDKSEKDR